MYLFAFAGQFVLDLTVNAVRDWFELGVPPRLSAATAGRCRSSLPLRSSRPAGSQFDPGVVAALVEVIRLSEPLAA